MSATPLTSNPATSAPRVAQPSQDVFVHGLPFWNATYSEFFGWWLQIVSSAERPGIVMPIANANTLNVAKKSPDFWRSLDQSDVMIMDGLGMRLACGMRGQPLRENLNGTDLIPRLFTETPVKLKVFLYGATEEANRLAAENVARRFPMVEVVGRANGYGTAEEAVQSIHAAAPDMVLVALGHPKQEIFCVTYRNAARVKLWVPCGGLLDFLSELKPRAPKLMRTLGLEWVYRLALEPRRLFARYVYGNPVFLFQSAVSAKSDRRLMKEARPGR